MLILLHLHPICYEFNLKNPAGLILLTTIVPDPYRRGVNQRMIQKFAFTRSAQLIAVEIVLLIFFSNPSKTIAFDSYRTLVSNTRMSADLRADPAALTEVEPLEEKLRRTTWLPPSMSQRNMLDKPSGMPDPSEMRADTDNFLKDYNEQIPFHGFYVRTNTAQDLDSGEHDLDYRLEWNLFKDGWYEMKKDFEKKRNQNELKTLQLLNDVMQHWLNQRLDEIKFLKYAAHYHQASEHSKLLANILKRRHVQLMEGYITRDDFDHIQFKYRQSELKKQLYAPYKDSGLAFDIHRLLNCGEFLSLIALAEIKKTAIKQAYPIKIQHNLAASAEFIESWSDELRVNLYVERRDSFVENTQNNVGVEMKIPLYWYSRRESSIEQEKKLYQKQAAVLSQRIESNVEKLYAFYNFQQNRIKTLLLELEKTARRKQYERERAKRVLENLDQTPERSLDLLLIEEIDLRFEAVLARLELYEILVKLMALTHATHPQDLVVVNQIDCPDHLAVPNGHFLP